MRYLGLLLGVALSLGLASCLTSDAPNLTLEDLVEAQDLPGHYTATALPGSPAAEQPAIEARLEASENRSYLLTFIETDHVDTPTRLQLLPDGEGRYLCVLTEAESPNQAMYARLERNQGGGWVFHVFDIKAGRRDDTLQPIVRRHGAEKVVFDNLGSNPPTTADHIQGRLSAAQIHALFGDPAFLAALQTDAGFRLDRRSN